MLNSSVNATQTRAHIIVSRFILHDLFGFFNWVSPGVQLYMSELTRKALKCLKNFCKVMKQKYREVQ